MRLIGAIDADRVPLRAELITFGRQHPGRRELSREYGLGALLATVVWEELGDTGSGALPGHDTGLSPLLRDDCMAPTLVECRRSSNVIALGVVHMEAAQQL